MKTEPKSKLFNSAASDKNNKISRIWREVHAELNRQPAFKMIMKNLRIM